ncbi:MgtC/SapB family protein [Haloarcula pelagica]|uniref:MgtC/SapB family protein n=1 Tax=Haloarcula pelagica TaxID=3033389 RepID=UPI0024C26739|nr:DUF4010 domain-containing protein [Halomicroarcula sp. YJ-61-S]
MTGAGGVLAAAPFDDTVVQLAVATALGMFLGLEREWSEKPAGIRTFSLASLLGAVFVYLESDLLLAVGGVFVVVQGVLIATKGLLTDRGLSLTTSASLLVAYGVGGLVAGGFLLEGVAVAVISTLLLVLKRELHTFAWGLSREELRSATEFAILAFVVYPLLPTEATIRLAGFSLGFEPRIVWLMVVFVAGIGMVNYTIVTLYGGRGIAITGFFGGLASSTAVVGTVVDHVKQRPSTSSYGIAAILLADAAMAVRNLAIVIAFTVPDLLVGVVVPVLVVVLACVAIAAATADWSEEFEVELQTPFSLRYALGFGAAFLVVVLAGAVGNAEFGAVGFYVTAALSGLVSSASATTSAVLLYRAGTLDQTTATVGVLLATVTSIVVKAGLTLTTRDRQFVGRVALWSVAVVAAGTAATAVVLLS